MSNTSTPPRKSKPLGRTAKDRPIEWDARKEEILRLNWGKVSKAQLAERLKTTEQSISSKGKWLGLPSYTSMARMSTIADLISADRLLTARWFTEPGSLHAVFNPDERVVNPQVRDYWDVCRTYLKGHLRNLEPAKRVYEQDPQKYRILARDAKAFDRLLDAVLLFDWLVALDAEGEYKDVPLGGDDKDRQVLK
jgi:hypothetical protein